MQLAIKTVKKACPEMLVMTDVALDPILLLGTMELSRKAAS